jgi:excinuclease ABC subunit C
MVSSVEKFIKKIICDLPSTPGVYQFFNSDDKIIYVGKAKNLKRRVSSYFTKNHVGKTKVLVNKTRDIKIVITETEQDALLLENSLIKKNKPIYNILLKDDKSYPWICISNENFPRVFSTRSAINNRNQYYGPYTSSKMLTTILNLIKEIFQLRDCNLNLSDANIKSSRYKVCLEYHIGNCNGPCVGEETEKDYLQKIVQIKNILNGNLSQVHSHLILKMNDFSENLEFEKAQSIKDSINLLESYQSKSIIVSSTISNIDVFGIYQVKDDYFVNYFKIKNGSIIQSHNAEIKRRFDESIEDILLHCIISFRQQFNSSSTEVLIPFTLDFSFHEFRFTIPKKGPKKKLIDLSFRNAKFHGLDTLKRQEKFSFSNQDVMEELRDKLHLKELPKHIECFDNSNIQGEFPVSACVVFKNGRPAKKEYRHFIIKEVVGPDDFASMAEVLKRRYTRLVSEGHALPDLIIIDGGKGQLSASVSALSSIGLDGKIPIIGIAKRLEEIFVPNDKFPIYINKNSLSLKLIQQCRNEAHRFGINHHRLRRSKSMINSELDQIKGIGIKTIQTLLFKYKSVEKLKSISKVNLINDIGISKANIIIDYFSR